MKKNRDRFFLPKQNASKVPGSWFHSLNILNRKKSWYALYVTRQERMLSAIPMWTKSPPRSAKDLWFHQQALHPLFRSFFQNSQLHLVTPLTVVQLVMDVFWFRQNANSCRCKIMIMSCIRINTNFSFTTSISNKPVSACIVAHRYRNSMISRKNIKYLSFHQASNSWNPVNSVCFPLRKKLSFERGNVTTTYKSPRYLDFATQNHGKMPSVVPNLGLWLKPSKWLFPSSQIEWWHTDQGTSCSDG